MLNASCLVPDKPRGAPRSRRSRISSASKRLPLISALFVSLAKFCDDGSIAIALCEPNGLLDTSTDQ